MRIVLLFLLFVTSNILAFDTDNLISNMLEPVVQVVNKSKFSGGSGVVIYSEKRRKDYRTFVITNCHVIEDSISIKDGVEYRDLIRIKLFKYMEGGNKVIANETLAYIVNYNVTLDLAFLEIVDRSKKYKTIDLYPQDKKLKLFQEVWNVGYPGLDPVSFAKGMIMGLNVDMFKGKFGTDAKYIKSNSPIYYGSSGGSTITQIDNKFYLIGLPTRIESTKIPYISYSVDINTIRKFIIDKNMNFIEDKSIEVPIFNVVKEKPIESLREFIIPLGH